MTALADTWALTVRDLLRLWRQPWFIAIVLVQPVIWLLLFGELFQRVVDIPGFEGGDYKQYLVPGVLVMTAFFSSGWSGMSTIEDIDRGVTDRLLVTPVRRWPKPSVSGKRRSGRRAWTRAIRAPSSAGARPRLTVSTSGSSGMERF